MIQIDPTNLFLRKWNNQEDVANDHGQWSNLGGAAAISTEDWALRKHVASQFVGMVDSTMISIWLVVWNIFFPYIGNVIIPTDELIFFRGVGSTTNQP